MNDYTNKKIALTIDVEDWYHTPAVSGSDFSYYKDVDSFMVNWKGRFDYLTEPTIRVLKILKEYNLNATFFVVADIVKYYPSIVEAIICDGHEIACHGLHHEIKLDSKTKKMRFSLQEFEERTFDAKKILEDFTGTEVLGYRAPGAYFSKFMFESLMNIGFKYDSSISPNSFYNKTDFKISEISSEPYKIFSIEETSSIIEIPWSYNNFYGFKLPTGGGPFVRFFSSNYIVNGIQDSLKRGSSVFYFHPIDISKESLPKLASSNSKRPFYFNTNGLKTELKLKDILCKFDGKWTTCESLIKSYL